MPIFVETSNLTIDKSLFTSASKNISQQQLMIFKTIKIYYALFYKAFHNIISYLATRCSSFVGIEMILVCYDMRTFEKIF